jgi:hypothetical protein
MVVTGQRQRKWTALALTVLCTARVQSTLASARVVGETTVTIKPCAAAFFPVQISREEPDATIPFLQLAESLMDRVSVNQRVYQNTFRRSPMSPAAVLIGDAHWLRAVEKEQHVFDATLMLFFDATEKKFLFDQPGRYDVTVGDTIRVTVMVEEPTDEEAVVANQMRDLGVEFIAWVLEQGQDRRPNIVPQVEALLAAHPDTVYTEMLSVCLGVSKYLESASDASEVGWDEVARRRSEAVTKYLEPYATPPFRSPFQSTAAFQVAKHWLDLDRRAGERTEDERAALRNRAKTLLKAVSDSPYSARFRREAASRVELLHE